MIIFSGCPMFIHFAYLTDTDGFATSGKMARSFRELPKEA
jgi:hypothetical protein